MIILYSFLSVTLLGLIFGVGLSMASKVLAVRKDEKVEAVEGKLPGINCGACGYAGCSGYAEAIAKEEEEDLTLCSPGGPDVALELAEIMGVEVEISNQRMVAQVFCRGNDERSKTEFVYQGVTDCNAAYLYFGGNKSCKYGCLGLDSCIKVCPVDAIIHDEDGCVWVDKELCISCGKCIDICPTGVMKLIPHEADYIVACNSKDKGAVTRKYCSVGCIGCKMCEKASPEGGYKVDNFLATIDYSMDGEREAASVKCPPKCILSLKGVTVKDEKN